MVSPIRRDLGDRKWAPLSTSASAPSLACDHQLTLLLPSQVTNPANCWSTVGGVKRGVHILLTCRWHCPQENPFVPALGTQSHSHKPDTSIITGLIRQCVQLMAPACRNLTPFKCRLQLLLISCPSGPESACMHRPIAQTPCFSRTPPASTSVITARQAPRKGLSPQAPCQVPVHMSTCSVRPAVCGERPLSRPANIKVRSAAGPCAILVY